ncbi:JmjC domain-containing histone demethylation protein 1 [Dimargaris verticillata]|uniref:JmjC domain-containing histone demethylation protein 1 n=1 Tax=Dimargaris verticillata TaxID=2761393 RepID=A0A9W8B3R1_9FUNG|nr:JmjC domain-containing histone demethylation protein 1 [Dimargaris verticillata]
MKPASKRKAAGSPTKAQARSKRRHSRDLCPLCPGNTAPHSRSQNKPASTNSSKSQDEESAVYDTWLQCNACRAWYHARCVGLAAAECQRIKRYHCQTCQPTAGPTVYYAQRTLRRSGRAHTVINYADLNEGVAGDVYKYTKLLQARTFAPSPFPVFETGQFLTATWLETHGLDEPILVRKPQGLGLVMPSPDLSVDEIAQLIGPETPVDVIDVANQGELTGWNLGQWAKYVNQRIRDRILNVISLEVSDTPLTRLIQRPRVVREIDWISTVWPTELKDQGEYPKVQHYCLMSVRDSYTDL